MCAECESRFDRLGENYTLRQAADGQRFRLLQTLEAATPSYSQKEWRGYKSADAPMVKRDDLAYFALSVFWRSAAHRWPNANGVGRTIRINLGERNLDALRRYLLGEIQVPETISLFFVVLTDRLSQSSFYLPSETGKQGFVWGFGFFACGLMFHLNVGKALEGRIGSCLIKSPERWIWVRDGEAKTLEAFTSIISRQPPEVRLK